MPVQNFGEAHPRKISEAKNMQNLAWFRTTSKFNGEYLRNWCIYSKSDSHFVYRDSSCVRRNKSGEVWSSDLADLDVKSYPLKRIIWKTVFRFLKGAAPPNFYTR